MRTIAIVLHGSRQEEEDLHIFQDLKWIFTRQIHFQGCQICSHDVSADIEENLITFVDIVCRGFKKHEMEIEIFPRLCFDFFHSLRRHKMSYTSKKEQRRTKCVLKKCVSWSWAVCCADFLYCFLSVFRHHCEQRSARSMCEPANTKKENCETFMPCNDIKEMLETFIHFSTFVGGFVERTQQRQLLMLPNTKSHLITEWNSLSLFGRHLALA